MEFAYLGAIHKLRHTNFKIFLPLPVLVIGGHIFETPFTQCDVTYFEILHLEIIKLKQQFRNYFISI